MMIDSPDENKYSANKKVLRMIKVTAGGSIVLSFVVGVILKILETLTGAHEVHLSGR